MPIVIAANHYGKSSVRIVRVSRHQSRHDLKEITFHIQLEGAFEAAYTSSDNSSLVTTDTMKNTVYALAKQGDAGEQIESFALRLAHHFLDGNAHVSQVGIEAIEHAWTRMDAHSFVRGASEKRTARIRLTRDGAAIEAGIADLVVLKTTGSGFAGYIRDSFTTLKETSDRILATAIKASWSYEGENLDYAALRDGVRAKILEVFAERESPSVQNTAYAMGEAVLEAFPAVTRIHFSLPNKHCLLVDLAPFGMTNENEVFVPTDEPHGLIEVELRRDPAGGSR
ncbi:MAG: factor-independent urate hydroxylase [Bryobacteraceae bacterium]